MRCSRTSLRRDFFKNRAEPLSGDMRFHDLRHTAATHIATHMLDLLAVSGRLGHTRASTTLDTYAHMVSGTQEKAAAL